MRAPRRLVAATTLLALCGCDLATPYVRPPAAVPGALPGVDAVPAPTSAPTGLQGPTLILDVRVRRLVERALAGDRDLRAAVASAASARALYRVQRSAERPTLSADGGAAVVPPGEQSGDTSSGYFASVGVNAYEIDLFGRLRNLRRAALADYLSSEAGVRAARLTVAAGVADACVTLAADEDLLKVARLTVEGGGRALDLTRSRQEAGLASGADVRNAAVVLEQARSDQEDDLTRVAQDLDALALLVGAPVAADEAPRSLAELDATLATLPAGVSSAVLLQRPDVMQAEHALQAAGARIGAARAAFFPTLTLTSGLGVASQALTSLVSGGAASFSFAATADAPLVGGPARGGLAYSKAQRDLALAEYDKAVQAAFRDVADGLARQGTIGRQRAAQAGLVTAADGAYQASLLRFKAGEGAFLASLIDQRTLYDARRSQVATLRTDLLNRVALAQALGRSYP